MRSPSFVLFVLMYHFHGLFEQNKKRSYNTQSCQTVSFVLSFVLRNAINFWFFCQQCFWVYIDYVQLSTTHVPIQVSSISSCGLTYSWIPKWIHQTMKKNPKIIAHKFSTKNRGNRNGIVGSMVKCRYFAVKSNSNAEIAIVRNDFVMNTSCPAHLFTV